MNITPVIEAVLQLLVAVAVVFIIPYIRKKLGNARMEEVLQWVDIAVAAAEQIFAASDGERKKQYVISMLWDKGYKLNDVEVNQMIEASVLRLHAELRGKEQEHGDSK